MIESRKVVFYYLFYLFLVNGLFSQSSINAIKPIDNTNLFNSNVLFEWNLNFKETSSSFYIFSLASDSIFSNTLLKDSLSSSNRVVSFNLAVPSKYYWKIELINSGEIIALSPIFNFTYSDVFQLSNKSLFFNVDTGLVLDSLNRVEKWVNLADSTNNAIQIDSSKRPTVSNNISNLNANKAIVLDGIDDVLSISSSVEIAEVFVVANWKGASTFPNFNGLLTGQTSFFIIIANGAGGNQTVFNNNSIFPTFLINGINTMNFSPLEKFKFINVKRPSKFTFNDLFIGKDRANLNRNWNGNIAEIIAFSEPLSDSLSNIVNSYFCSKYSVPLSLGEDVLMSYGFCDTLFQADTSFQSYRWSNGDTTSFSTLSPGNTYQLTVTNQFGCEFTDEVAVVIPFENQKDQVICRGDSFIWDTKLSNFGYTFAWSDFSSDSIINITSPGDYYVIITDSNNCSFNSDTITVQLDSNLLKTNLGPDTSLCEGNVLSLKNAPANINSYSWSTGSKQATIPVDTSGNYSLEFSDGFCTVRDSIQVIIKGLAPTADFLSTDFCFQDSTKFTNTSILPSGDSLFSIHWDFDDGTDTNSLNPGHRFPAAGSYRVQLTVTSDKQCVDTIGKLIQIQPKPLAEFGLFRTVNCSKNPIKFTDSSSVSSGNIAGYFWNFGDSLSNNNSSNNQEPTHIYDTLGSYDVMLTVETDQGCKDTTIKTVFIDPSPFVDFTFSGSCLNDSTRFQDRSILPLGEVNDYLWVANNQISLKKNPAFKFLSSGKKPIVLRLTTKAGCETVLRDSIDIFENPKADFSQLSSCLGQPLRFQDQSTTAGEIVFWQYIFNQQDTAFEANPLFQSDQSGNFPLSLKVTDDNGCEDSTEKNVAVNPNPKALFNLETDQAGVPFEIGISNFSEDAAKSFWDFGDGNTSTQNTPSYTYQDTGKFIIQLKVESEEGCADSISKQIVALPSLIDGAIDQLELFQDAFGEVGLRVRLINSGNNTIRSIRLIADVNNQFKFIESFDLELFRARSTAVTFATQFLPEEGRDLDFICVRIDQVNQLEDENEANNELCKEAFNEKISLNVFPNPTADILNFEFVLPESGELELSVYDHLGRKVIQTLDGFFEAGFHQRAINVLALRPGLYYFTLRQNDQKIEGTFIKR